MLNITRAELKLAAKGSIRNARPHPMLVTLVYLLIPAAAYLIVTLLTGGVEGYRNLYYASLTGDPYQIEAAKNALITGPTFLVFFLQLLLSFASMVFSVGYMWYALRLARRQACGYANLFDGFAEAGRVLLTGILMGVFVFLWSLLLIIPGIIAAYRYRMAFYILFDNPEVGALQAISMSKEMMRGHKLELFVLDLSFIGWLILVPLTLGILGLWVTPYMTATEANFYDSLNGRFIGEAMA